MRGAHVDAYCQTLQVIQYRIGSFISDALSTVFRQDRTRGAHDRVYIWRALTAGNWFSGTVTQSVLARTGPDISIRLRALDQYSERPLVSLSSSIGTNSDVTRQDNTIAALPYADSQSAPNPPVNAKGSAKFPLPTQINRQFCDPALVLVEELDAGVFYQDHDGPR